MANQAPQQWRWEWNQHQEQILHQQQHQQQIRQQGQQQLQHQQQHHHHHQQQQQPQQHLQQAPGGPTYLPPSSGNQDGNVQPVVLHSHAAAPNNCCSPYVANCFAPPSLPHSQLYTGQAMPIGAAYNQNNQAQYPQDGGCLAYVSVNNAHHALNEAVTTPVIGSTSSTSGHLTQINPPLSQPRNRALVAKLPERNLSDMFSDPAEKDIVEVLFDPTTMDWRDDEEAGQQYPSTPRLMYTYGVNHDQAAGASESNPTPDVSWNDLSTGVQWAILKILSKTYLFSTSTIFMLRLSRNQIQDFVSLYLHCYDQWQGFEQECLHNAELFVNRFEASQRGSEGREVLAHYLQENRPLMPTEKITAEDAQKGCSFLTLRRLDQFQEELLSFSCLENVNFLDLDVNRPILRDCVNYEFLRKSVASGVVTMDEIVNAARAAAKDNMRHVYSTPGMSEGLRGFSRDTALKCLENETGHPSKTNISSSTSSITDNAIASTGGLSTFTHSVFSRLRSNTQTSSPELSGSRTRAEDRKEVRGTMQRLLPECQLGFISGENMARCIENIDIPNSDRSKNQQKDYGVHKPLKWLLSDQYDIIDPKTYFQDDSNQPQQHAYQRRATQGQSGAGPLAGQCKSRKTNRYADKVSTGKRTHMSQNQPVRDTTSQSFGIDPSQIEGRPELSAAIQDGFSAGYAALASRPTLPTRDHVAGPIHCQGPAVTNGDFGVQANHVTVPSTSLVGGTAQTVSGGQFAPPSLPESGTEPMGSSVVGGNTFHNSTADVAVNNQTMQAPLRADAQNYIAQESPFLENTYGDLSATSFKPEDGSSNQNAKRERKQSLRAQEAEETAWELMNSELTPERPKRKRKLRKGTEASGRDGPQADEGLQPGVNSAATPMFSSPVMSAGYNLPDQLQSNNAVSYDESFMPTHLSQSQAQVSVRSASGLQPQSYAVPVNPHRSSSPSTDPGGMFSPNSQEAIPRGMMEWPQPTTTPDNSAESGHAAPRTRRGTADMISTSQAMTDQEGNPTSIAIQTNRSLVELPEELVQLELRLQNTASQRTDGGDTGDVGSDDDDALVESQIATSEEGKGPTAKKKRDDAVFQSWLEKNQREVTKASKEVLERHQEQSSVFQLDVDSVDKKIISSPREYQIELFERAKEQNTIVVLDTGSGKTLIAALLLRHILGQELQDRSQGFRQKVAFFVVEKVALCFQQHAVLSCNLEFPIEKFYGEMAGVSRTKDFWDKKLSESMAFVCTAQMLLDLLACGFIQMNQMNLLIFDEAHHTKKNHPYARIIKDHYLRSDERPRILGMTASPVDSQTKDIRLAATELESLLCSKIATVSDAALMESQAHKQQIEIKEYYHRLENPEDSRTLLWKMIARCVRENIQFKAHLEFAQIASSTLGTWCADRYWQLLMTDSELDKLEARTARDTLDFGVSTTDEAMAAVRSVKQIIKDHQPSIICKDSLDLSCKVRSLHEVLQDAFYQRKAKRCIVFVQVRSTAFLLADLYEQPGMHIKGMRAGYMIGSNTASAGAASMSYRDQVSALQKFRYGDTNCLFATSVAEEGIDIPECDVIIRFDLYHSAIQYIQSKGRARQKSSLYISMLEEGNMEHMRRLRQATRDAHALRQFCSSLPEDRKVQDFVLDTTALAQHEQYTQKTHTIIETGACLTFTTSLDVLSKFASSLPGANNGGNNMEYMVTSLGKKFIARIIFPDTSPVKTASGEPQRSKQLARCSVAFEACLELIRKKYIDGHLQPAFAKRLPAMRNARLALKSDKKSEYDMRLKPEFWSKNLGKAPKRLFPTPISLDGDEILGRAARPLLILSRHPLPEVPAIPLFFGNGRTSVARLSASKTPICVSVDELEALTSFTLTTFRDVFSKEYDATSEDVPYFIAPSDNTLLNKEQAHIDWTTIQYVKDNDQLSWKWASGDFFRDKFVLDPWDGSRKFITNGVNKALKPSDSTPKGVPQPKSLAYRKVEQNIKEYSNSLSLLSRKRRCWRDDQPVVNAELLSIRRNFLDEFILEEESNRNCVIILEPLIISPLPVDIVSTALVLPVIMYRIDSTLISLEACSIVGLTIQPALALEAVTKDSFNTEEHGEDQIDFQAGMGRNYERLEFLGDTFLKMATTISVFTLIPNGDEFEYHVERMLMLCNSNLFSHAVEHGLQQYIRTRAFDRRTWYPSNMTLKRGKASKNKLRHRLSHKSIADVCEALIGAAYMSHGEDMDMAVKAVTAMVNSENHRMTTFGDYFTAFNPPEWHSREATAVQRHAVDQIAQAIDYRFKSAPLLRSAFKHPSYTFETIPDYQRLEFLGDALLDMAIVDFLFRRFPEADPKWLTEHKMAMVSNQFLGCLCAKLGLHKHILVATSALLGDIREYVSQLEQAEELARLKVRGGTSGGGVGDGGGETCLAAPAATAASASASASNSLPPPPVAWSSTAQRGGPPQPPPPRVGPGAAGAAIIPRDFWMDAPQPPKALADVLEALVGAMFVDSGYSYPVVQRFFMAFVQPYFEDMALYDSFASNHPVTALAHKLQGDFGCSRWRLHLAVVPPPLEAGVAVLADSCDELVCALMVHGKVVCHATAKNGSEVKVAVAKMALGEALRPIRDGDHFRAEMGCDCGGSGSNSNTVTGA